MQASHCFVKCCRICIRLPSYCCTETSNCAECERQSIDKQEDYLHDCPGNAGEHSADGGTDVVRNLIHSNISVQQLKTNRRTQERARIRSPTQGSVHRRHTEMQSNQRCHRSIRNSTQSPLFWNHQRVPLAQRIDILQNTKMTESTIKAVTESWNHKSERSDISMTSKGCSLT